MTNPPGSLTVGDVFPDFGRDSEALTALRRLRTAQFIRPADRDRWEAGERIEIKPIARLLWDRLGEAAIFGDAPEAQPAEEPEAQPAPEPEKAAEDPEEAVAEAAEEEAAAEEIDLSLPGVNAADDERTVRMTNDTHTAWDEADVLSFLNDDEVVKAPR